MDSLRVYWGYIGIMEKIKTIRITGLMGVI